VWFVFCSLHGFFNVKRGPRDFFISPIDIGVEEEEPGEAKDESVFAQAGKVESLYSALFSLSDQEVTVLGDPPAAIFSPIYIV